MRFSLHARGLLLAGLLAVTASVAHAQFRTSIQGTVTDPTGAVLPGATLTLKDNGTNQVITRTSDARGVFNFNALPSDVFTLTADHPGFQEKVLADLQLIPEQPNSVNVSLAPAGKAQEVTVNASTAPALDAETANTGGTITARDYNYLPSFNRDPFTLQQLIPGVIDDGSQTAGGGVYTVPGIGSNAQGSTNGGAAPTENGPPLFANGGQMENNSISIDGISTSSAVWGGSTVITPDEDSVANVRVLSNDYDAEYGRYSGAQTLVTSKSGTNDFHGSAFLGIHRPGLNAYQHRIVIPGDLTTNPVRDTARFNQYGGSLGGPIWKNRVFFFFDYESSPQKTTTVGNGWYETPAFDALAPANSIAATYLTFPGTQPTQQGIVDTTCAAAGLTQGVNCNYIAGQGLNLGTPLTTPPGTQDLTDGGTSQTPGVGSGLGTTADIANYIVTSPYASYYRDYNGRIDANLTKADHVAFAMYWVPQGNSSYNPNSRTYNLFHHHQVNDAFSVIWDHTFSPNFLNEARANAAGYRWNEITDNPQAPVGLPADTILTPGSASIAQFGSALGSILNQWTYGYKDVATKIVGTHTIKFGGDFTNLHYLSDPIGRPNYSFYDIWDFLNDAPYMETGNFDTATGLPGGARQDFRENLFGAFVQDDWRVRPNITLHAGIRYSYFGSLYDKQNNLSTVQMGTGADEFTGINVRVGGHLWNPQKFNFGPQLAFDWSPSLFKDKMVVRGGYGLNFNQEEIAISSSVNGNPPVQGYYDFTFTNPTDPGTNGADIIYGTSSNVHSLNGFASNPNTITSYNSNNLPTAGNSTLYVFGNGRGALPTQYLEHYSLDVQYEFNNWLVASLGYQGSVGHHLMVQYLGNATALAAGVPLNPLVTSTNWYGDEGSSSNNAMLAELKHPFSHHFSLDAQYMWAHSMDDTSQPYEINPYYPENPYYSRGRSDYDIRDSFKLFGLWQPVIFHGDHGWLEKVAGGWSLSGILNLHTGFGWTPSYGTPDSLYCSNCGYYTLYPYYKGGGARSTSNKAFETQSNFPNYAAAIAAQQEQMATVNGATVPVSYSNSYFDVPNYDAAISGGSFPSMNSALPPPPGIGRNAFNGPGYRDVDASITKTFGLPKMPILGSNAGLDIRADAFNLFNITNLNPGDISTNITLPNFGQDTTILGSRTVSIQARFHF